MRFIALTVDVALQLGLPSLEPALLGVDASDELAREADVALVDLGSTAQGLAAVADLRGRGINAPCVVVGETAAIEDPSTVPLLRPFTLDELREMLLSTGEAYVLARGGVVEDRPSPDAEVPAQPPADLRRLRKERARAEKEARAARIAREKQLVREERERRARVSAEERAGRVRAEQAERERAEERARAEREEAERQARLERERAAEAERAQRAAKAERERAEQAARAAEEAARKERERAEVAAARELQRAQEAARRELAALAGRDERDAEAEPVHPVEALESKRTRKERRLAERAMHEAERARQERERAEEAAREEQVRAEEAARAEAAARQARIDAEREFAERERVAAAERRAREEAERRAREEQQRQEEMARAERERAEQIAREERRLADEAARRERERAAARAKAERIAREERAKADKIARQAAEREARDEAERVARVEAARAAAVARAEDMARRERAQIAAREREAAAARARPRTRVAPPMPAIRRVDPPQSFVIPPSRDGFRGPPVPAADLVPERLGRVQRRRARLPETLSGRGFRARQLEQPPSPAGEMARRVETALRAGGEIETILGMLPGLETPLTTAEAFMSELRDAIALKAVAIYGRDGDLFSILAAEGITKVERAGTVTADQALFRELTGGNGVLIDPVDLARGTVAGVACATARVLMAAPLWNEGRCHGVVVVGGDSYTDDDLRKLCRLAERAAPSFALSQLIEGLRSALT